MRRLESFEPIEPVIYGEVGGRGVSPVIRRLQRATWEEPACSSGYLLIGRRVCRAGPTSGVVLQCCPTFRSSEREMGVIGNGKWGVVILGLLKYWNSANALPAKIPNPKTWKNMNHRPTLEGLTHSSQKQAPPPLPSGAHPHFGLSGCSDALGPKFWLTRGRVRLQ